MRIKHFLLLLLALFQFSFCYTQERRDTLINKEYNYIEDLIFKNPKDTIASNFYAQLFLNKAVYENNEDKIIDGYYFFSIINDFITSLKYCDSTLLVSEKIKNYKHVGITYLRKGNLFYSKGDYEKALKNYLEAEKKINKIEQPNSYFIIMNNIGIIKGFLNQHDEALNIHLKSYNHIVKERLEEEYIDNYLGNMFSIGHLYSEINKPDSSTVYNLLGIKKSLFYNRDDYYSLFILSEGKNLLNKQKYLASIDSITKALPLLSKNKDTLNTVLAYIYKGKALLMQKDTVNALIALKKADTMIFKKRSYLSQFSDAYELLYDIHKKKGDHNNQLVYLEKLINYNKVVKFKYNSLQDKMNREYDIPKLISEKENLILRLEADNNISSKILYILSFLFIVITVLCFFYYKKKKIYKKRYEKLIKNNKIQENITIETKEEQTKKIELSKEVIESILQLILKFEEDKKFLSKDITLGNMAKKMNTNSNYLSKIINVYKKKNFSNYINDLRIEYVVNELKTSKKLRNYTVKAVAFEIGFKNSESFTKAFQKHTGIYPSYYIRKLKKES